jgi:hypothetical protein
VWAVGTRFNGQSSHPGGRLTLIEHWDGRSWSVVEGPSTGPGNSRLVAASGISFDDVWAVGGFEATDDPATGPEAPLIEHWDGGRWSIVPAPIPPGHQSQSGIELTGVVALAPDDAWAVGFDDILGTNGATTPRTLAEHWDGRSWTVVPSANVDDGSILVSIAAVSPTDVWAVGASYAGYGEISRSRALVEHWDGTTWTIVPVPGAHGGQPSPGIVETVTATRPNDVWVAWARSIVRWDGTTWTDLTAPGRVLALTGLGPHDVWAVGDVLAHWDGREWTTVPLDPGPPGSTFNAVGVTPAGDVWAVGGLGYADGHQHPFALRRCAGPSPPSNGSASGS